MWGWERGRGACLLALLLSSVSPPPFFSLSPSLPAHRPSSPSIRPSFPLSLFFSLSPTGSPHPLSPHSLSLSPPPSLLSLSLQVWHRTRTVCFAPGRVQTQREIPRFLRGALKTLPYLYYPHSLTSPTPSPVLPNFPRNLCKACGGENICTKSEGARQGRLYHALSRVWLLQSL